jgi:hypothetical protein
MQIEEAKRNTDNKLKVFKRDRLFNQDKDRTTQLSDCLKLVR